MRRSIWFMFACLSMPSLATAQDNYWHDKLQVRGFVSQAYIHTSDNKFYGNSEKGSFGLTELGLNANFEFSPSIRLAGQLLSRRAANTSSADPHVDFALIDINFVNNINGRFGTYVGRVKNPIGLFNETRDVAHTREGILVPQSAYFDRIRNTILSSDGIHLYADRYIDNDVLMFQFGSGYAPIDENLEYEFLGQSFDGKFRMKRPGLFGRILYEQDGGRWIYSLTSARVRFDFRPGAADQGLTKGNFQIDHTVLSVQHNAEKWRLTAEVLYQYIDYTDISPSFDFLTTNAFAYLLQANYQFNRSWQAFIRYEEFQLDKNSWNGRALARGSRAVTDQLAFFGIEQSPMPEHVFYYKNVAVGGRWDVTPSLMLRAEYHWSNGTAILSPREVDLATSTRRWNMFSLALAYRF